MNLSQLCRELQNVKISDSVYASKFIKDLNAILPVAHDVDVSKTGFELQAWFDVLPIDLKSEASVVVLSTEEAQALKTELISLKEIERNKEAMDHQIKHNLVFGYAAVALAVVGFCVYAYLTTKGVDVEQTSQFLAGLKEVITLLVDIGGTTTASPAE